MNDFKSKEVTTDNLTDNLTYYTVCEYFDKINKMADCLAEGNSEQI